LTPSYQIIDLSAELRERQRATVQALAPECAAQLSWLESLPSAFEGIVLANEVLDAMPVKLLQKANGQWAELCVTVADGALAWAQQPSSASPPVDWADALPDGYLTEIAPQAEAFMRTMAAWLTRGAAFFIDYGFAESEYYHPQRSTGSLMCHYQHTAHPNPLLWPGLQDITAHVNFTGVALAAQDAGLAVLGYTSQARFLLNCGILDLLEKVQKDQNKSTLTPIKETSAVQKLLAEHEMGELFKVLAVGVGLRDGSAQLLGFTTGDRSHTL
jgi:SAM-dependent MidA family methyltransferase